MSLSKGKLADEQPRRPKCSRCRHHGIVVPQKGHTKRCPFLKCDCWKCFLITQRTQIAALQRNLRKAQSAEPERAGGASEPEESAPPSAASGATRPPSGGAPERATSHTDAARGPLDLRRRNALPRGALYSGEFGQTAPLSVVHFPFRMSGHFPSTYSLFPNHLLNTPWPPPMPPGLFEGLCRPLMLPHFQPPPEPAPTPVFPPPPASEATEGEQR